MAHKDLQAAFGKAAGDAASVEFVMGCGEMAKAVLRNGTAVAEVYLHGAHVTRWGYKGYEALWMSADAVYTEGKPLRGGIPICWPQFGGLGPLKAHGFLRYSDDWKVERTAAEADGTVEVVLTHSDTAATRELWAHTFTFKYTVRLGANGDLTTAVDVDNTGDAPFEFTAALHTYFDIPHISKARMEGFAGVTYLDQLQGKKEIVEDSGSIAITAETDRIYLDTPNELAIQDGWHAKIGIKKSDSLPDAVLWNPWVKKASNMGDFHNYGWTSMVCIEAAAIGKAATVPAKGSWSASQSFAVALAE
eukprot:TRINITY_DN7910_c0_g2_i1.p1 TRINITY_DN7910_c0_g2~~TRINITY_DN7910_c0_g2_i1.p1  ORF type:complete len:322 (+),score=135.08 TRINITY_DN7910_c0_g2_i1:53-967(+)